MLEETGLSRSTLYEALRRLKRMGLVSKAIRDDDRPVYKAEVTRSALETLASIGDYLNYGAIRVAVRDADEEAFFDALTDVFLLIGAAFITELQIEAVDSTSGEDLRRRLGRVRNRIVQASSKILDRILKELSAEPEKARQLLTPKEA